MRNSSWIKHGVALLALLFLASSGCTDNSNQKAQLASMQAQMAAQAQLNQAALTNAHNQTKLTCYANATDVNSKALCDKL